ncbi:hypothetical protein ACTFIY_011960 [Dictyostelium cf. discoideum]
MGNYFFKEQEKEMSVVVVNKERELDVYLNVYANSSDQLVGEKIYKKGAIEELVGTNSGHYSIIIDRNGESDDDQHPVGFEIHLVMKRPDLSNETAYTGDSRNHNSSKLIKTVKVGKAILFQTKEYAEANNCDKKYIVDKHFNSLFDKFIEEQCSGDIYWGRKNNCHNYARLCIESLKLSWPDSVVSPADGYPILIDVLKIQKCASIATNQTSNQTN